MNTFQHMRKKLSIIFTLSMFSSSIFAGNLEYGSTSLINKFIQDYSIAKSAKKSVIDDFIMRFMLDVSSYDSSTIPESIQNKLIEIVKDFIAEEGKLAEHDRYTFGMRDNISIISQKIIDLDIDFLVLPILPIIVFPESEIEIALEDRVESGFRLLEAKNIDLDLREKLIIFLNQSSVDPFITYTPYRKFIKIRLKNLGILQID